MRKLQERIVRDYVDLIWEIAASRYVKVFVVGYTAAAAKRRRYGYRSNGYNHLIVIADRLTKIQAHDLERRLQDACKAGAPCGPCLPL